MRIGSAPSAVTVPPAASVAGTWRSANASPVSSGKHATASDASSPRYRNTGASSGTDPAARAAGSAHAESRARSPDSAAPPAAMSGAMACSVRKSGASRTVRVERRPTSASRPSSRRSEVAPSTSVASSPSPTAARASASVEASVTSTPWPSSARASACVPPGAGLSGASASP
nr:hypothetical protein [Clavibacter michiganensis]